jgi:hypothetical protein
MERMDTPVQSVGGRKLRDSLGERKSKAKVTEDPDKNDECQTLHPVCRSS